MNEVVDDVALRAIPMHYDHGNGLAAADVNGDGFVDIYFVSQLGSNELWLNRGDGSFELSPDNQVLEVADRVSVAASFADTDNDGDADLYVTTVRDGNLFFENKGGRFTDMTEQSGLGYKGHSSGVVFFDANNDGLLDLFLSNVGEYTTSRRAESNYCIGYEDAFFFHKDASRSEASRLYLNRGENTFQDVSENYLPKALGWNGDAFFHDFNRDGLADLYVLNMQGDDSVLFNKRGKAFELASTSLVSMSPWGSMFGTVVDVDNDGAFEAFVTDMHSDMIEDLDFGNLDKEYSKNSKRYSEEFLQDSSNNIVGNALFGIEASKPWVDKSDALGLETYWPWGASLGDFNADGFTDIFITASMNFPRRYHPNSLMLNNKGEGFVDQSVVSEIEPRLSDVTHKEWFRLRCDDLDKLKKICQECKANKELAQCGATLSTGEMVVYGSLGSRSSVVFDIENDGDLDIITNEFGSRPQVLVNQREQSRNHLRLYLEGQRSNRMGLGAIVTLRFSDGEHQVQALNGKSGYLSQSSLPLYWSWQASRKPTSLEVKWPGGVLQQTDIESTRQSVELRIKERL
ncbi:MAG: CRTAC1 family protein [Bdellovibrionales bacterium]|nr:CRTAC1 family protein [Bdellovibrionales bacterium]